jgi:hypothetical protein
MATWFDLTFTGDPTERDFRRVAELAAQGFTSGQLLNDPEDADEEGPATGWHFPSPPPGAPLGQAVTPAQLAMLSPAASTTRPGGVGVELCDPNTGTAAFVEDVRAFLAEQLDRDDMTLDEIAAEVVAIATGASPYMPTDDDQPDDPAWSALHQGPSPTPGQDVTFGPDAQPEDWRDGIYLGDADGQAAVLPRIGGELAAQTYPRRTYGDIYLVVPYTQVRGTYMVCSVPSSTELAAVGRFNAGQLPRQEN